MSIEFFLVKFDFIFSTTFHPVCALYHRSHSPSSPAITTLVDNLCSTLPGKPNHSPCGLRRTVSTQSTTACISASTCGPHSQLRTKQRKADVPPSSHIPRPACPHQQLPKGAFPFPHRQAFPAPALTALGSLQM